MPETFWPVPFPCLACNVKPRKQRAAVAEDCQGRFLSLPLLHKHVQLLLSQRLFDWFCSLFEPFLNKVVILLYPLVMTELTAVMAAASTMTLESRRRGILHRLQMDFHLLQKKQQKLESLSQLKAFCGAWFCSW